MRPPGYLLIRASLATIIAAGASSVIVVPAVGIAAEAQVLAQDLVNVRASDKLSAALWTRRPDSYTLQLVFTGSGCGRRRGLATVASPAPQEAAQASDGTERSAFFIGNTIANLRGLDPCFGDRTLTLTDGRRTAQGSSQPDSSRPAQQALPQMVVAVPPKDPSVLQVWLLRADGTQIPPVAVTAEYSTAYGCGPNCSASGKLFRFPLVESTQAIAAVIRVDDDFYIEKLRPLEPAPITP